MLNDERGSSEFFSSELETTPTPNYEIVEIKRPELKDLELSSSVLSVSNSELRN